MIQRSSDLRMTAWVVETQASGTASKVLPPGAGDTRTPSRSDPRPMTSSCTSRRQYRALGRSGRSHCRTRNRCASAVLSSRGPVVALREAVVAVRSLELIMTISPRSRLYRLERRDANGVRSRGSSDLPLSREDRHPADLGSPRTLRGAIAGTVEAPRVYRNAVPTPDRAG